MISRKKVAAFFAFLAVLCGIVAVYGAATGNGRLFLGAFLAALLYVACAFNPRDIFFIRKGGDE